MGDAGARAGGSAALPRRSLTTSVRTGRSCSGGTVASLARAPLSRSWRECDPLRAHCVPDVLVRGASHDTTWSRGRGSAAFPRPCGPRHRSQRGGARSGYGAPTATCAGFRRRTPGARTRGNRRRAEAAPPSLGRLSDTPSTHAPWRCSPAGTRRRRARERRRGCDRWPRRKHLPPRSVVPPPKGVEPTLERWGVGAAGCRSTDAALLLPTQKRRGLGPRRNSTKEQIRSPLEWVLACRGLPFRGRQRRS